MGFDMVIRGGTVLDGSGGEPFEADVAVTDGRIAEVGNVSGKGKEELDAKGQWVTPGFVDVHTHYDGQATWDDQMSPSSLHGVTTIVTGNCGVGFAPVREGDRDCLIQLMEGVEDIPGTALAEGLPWTWDSFPEYLDQLAARSYDVDVATQLAHGPLRVYVMGERGVAREPATPEDIERMSALVTEALNAGAYGVTTSRTVFHRTSDGRLTPMYQAAEEELVGLARGVRAAGHGVIELISDFNDLEKEFAQVRRMAEVGGCPVSVSVIQQDLVPGRWKEILDRISGAAQDGLDMWGQVFARPVGVLMSLDASLHPFMSHPGFREVADLPLRERVAAMRDSERRQRILAEQPVTPHPFVTFFGKKTEKMFEMGADLNYAPTEDLSVKARAAARGVTEQEYLYDALLQRDGKQLIYFPFHNYAAGTLDVVREMLEHPRAVFGLSDGGAHVASICDSSVTTYQLSYWCSDAAPGGAMKPEWVVHKQTQQTAKLVGLKDRGVIAQGLLADLNVIDPQRLALREPKLVRDLPAGGARFIQTAAGYTATIKNGTVTYRDGEPTGDRPGRLLRATS